MSDYSRIRMRRASATLWTDANPVLGLGEGGFEVDTNKLKIGDGSGLWTELDYIKVDPSSIAHPTVFFPIYEGYDQKILINLSDNEHLSIIGSGDTTISFDDTSKSIVINSNSGDEFLTYENIIDRLGYIPQQSGSYSIVGHSHVISSISGLQTQLDNKQPTGLYSINGHIHSLMIGDGTEDTIQYNSNQRLNIIGSGYSDVSFDEYTNTIIINSIGNSGVTLFNDRLGSVTLTFTDITGSLGYVPQPVGSYTLTGHTHNIADIIDLSFSKKTPSSSVASGNSGNMCWDNNFLYMCIADNSWKRIPLLSW